MPEPTPRPWRLLPGGLDEQALWAPNVHAFSLDTAHFERWKDVRERRDYIVRAVNALPELVALAEQIVEAAKPGRDEWCDADSTEFAVLDEDVIDRARRALALARGEEETNDE